MVARRCFTSLGNVDAPGGNVVHDHMVTNCVYSLALTSQGPVPLFNLAATCHQLLAITEDCCVIDRNQFSLPHPWRRVLWHGRPVPIRSMMLTGHTSGVYCVSPLPNGQIVSGSFDKCLRIWDLATGECTAELINGHTAFSIVSCIASLPDGQIVSGDVKSLRIWDLATGECVAELKGHKAPLHCVAPLPNGQIVSGSFDKSLRIWDLATGECTAELKGHTGTVHCVAPLPNGQIVSCSDDKSVWIWD